MQGTITATAGGTIGGFAIGTNDLTATNFSLDTSAKRLTLGSSNNIFIADADDGIHLGNATFASAPFSVTKAGALKATNADITGKISATSGDIGGFSIDASTISSSNNNLILKSSGQITGSTVQFSGGTIGGFDLGSTSLSTTTFQLSASTNANDPVSFISSSDFKVSANGRITASAGLIAGFSIIGDNLDSVDGTLKLDGGSTPTVKVLKDSDEFVEMFFNSAGDYGLKGVQGGNAVFKLGSANQIAGWTFDNEKIFNTGVIISASYGFKVNDGTDDGNDFVDIAYRNDSWGIKGRSAGVNIFELGSTNQIAGWTFDNEKLVGGQMIISKDGTIQSDGFVTNLPGSGFRLTAASGGMLEVENARIRGTLSTAVFEKETVNAVGGQLYVANSTVLTSSVLHPDPYYTATDTTMSVVNVTGFTGSYNDDGEILALKKVTDTGFATEYVLVQSASRNSGGSENDFSGNIYVIRGYTANEQTSSLGDLVSVAQTYSGSQVLVSTGRPGTGYIRLNANPNDPSTPYMQIVERTGSGVYDLSLKAQVGDLSGITDNRFSDGVSGFGIYTENGYFKGKIEVAGGDFAAKPRKDYRLAYISSGSVNADPSAEQFSMGRFLSASLGYVGGNFENNHYSYSSSNHGGNTKYNSFTSSNGTWHSVVTGSDKPGDIIGISGSGYDLFVVSCNGYGAHTAGQMILNLFDQGYSVLTQGNSTYANVNLTGSGGTEWPIKKGARIDGSDYGTHAARGSHSGSIATGSFSPLNEQDPILQGWLSPGDWITENANNNEDSNPFTRLYSDGGGGTFIPLAQRNPTWEYSGSTSGSADGDLRTNTKGGAHYLAYYATNPRGGRWVHMQSPLYPYQLYDENPIAAQRILDFLLKKDIAQESYQQGLTTITGDMISTGKIRSTNLSTTVGTELGLNDGVIKIGGTSAYTSNNGILLDGPNAQFAVGNASGEYVRFNHTADTLEINTSNFSIDASGNVSITGDITLTNPEDLPLPPGISDLSSSIESSLSLLGSFTSSLNTSLSNLGSFTASVNATTGSIAGSLTSLGTATASLNAATGSINSSLTAVGVVTASLADTQSLLNQHIATLGELTESLNASLVELGTATASIDISLADLGNATASLNAATASLQTLITLAEQNMFRLWVTGSLNQLKQSTNERGMYYGTSYYNNEPLNLIFDTGPVDVEIPDDGDGYADSIIYHFHSPDATTGSIRINGNDFEGDVEVAFNDPSGSHHRELSRAGTNPTVNGPLFFNGNNNNIWSSSADVVNFGDTTSTARNVNLDNNIWEFNDVAIKAGLNELHIWSDGSGDGTNPRLRHVALFRHGEPTDAGALVLNPTPAGSGLYIGQSHLGYYAGGDWQTYMSSSGDFLLKGTTSEGSSADANSGSLTWNAAKSELAIQGKITVGAGHGGVGPIAQGLVLDFGGPSGSLESGLPSINYLALASQSNADIEGHTGWRVATGSVSTLYTYNGTSGNTNDATTKINGVRIGTRNGQLFTSNTTRTLSWGSLENLIFWKDYLAREDGQTIEWDIDAMWNGSSGGYPWMGGFCGLTRPGYETATHAEKVNVRPWYGDPSSDQNQGKFRECGFYVNSWHIYYGGSNGSIVNATGIKYGAGSGTAGALDFNDNHGLPEQGKGLSGYVLSEEDNAWFGGSGYGYGSYFDKYKLSITILPGGGQDMKIFRYYRGTGAYKDEDGNFTYYLPASQSLVPVWQETVGNTNGSKGHATGSVLQLALGNYYTSNHMINKITVSPAGTAGGTSISGDRITTGKLRSSNFGPHQGSEIDLTDGTITFGGSLEPRFSVTPPGFVTATNITERLVEVTDANKSLYFLADGANTKLVFDGSLGGLVCMNMSLTVAPPGKVTDFILPASLSDEAALVGILCGADDIKFDNTDVAPGYQQMVRNVVVYN